MKPQDYEVVIRPLSAEHCGGFLATVPELPGCMSDGDDAIVCWVEACREMGRPVPEPKRAAA